jgi:RecA-family ATPase
MTASVAERLQRLMQTNAEPHAPAAPKPDYAHGYPSVAAWLTAQNGADDPLAQESRTEPAPAAPAQDKGAQKAKQAHSAPDNVGEAPVEAQDEIAVLPVVTASSLAGKPAPPRSWHVLGMVPDRTVTMLGGDGSVGKSTLAEQLGVATAADKPWLGLSPQPGPVVYLSAEDDLDELNRRLEDIATSYGVDIADLGDFHFVPLAGMDAVLAVPQGRTGIISATRIWRGLVAVVERYRPCLVIIDTLADVFAGNENVRTEARQFIGLLRGLAIRFDLAVLLLGHPSLTGLKDGTGTSGSTGWNNSVRSRLYLETIKDEKGRQIDADIRVLSVKKLNYGPADIELRLRWSRGCFVLDGPTGGFDKLTADAKAERVFLDLLIVFTDQQRDVSPNPSRSYAPTVFANHPDAEGLRKGALETAMNRLLKTHRIRVETSGPPSRQRSRLVIAQSEEPAS